MATSNSSLKYYNKKHDGDWVTKFINKITKLYINYNDLTNFPVPKYSFFSCIHQIQNRAG